MSRPRISILMPTWDAGRLIGRTLESALAQTCGDLELFGAWIMHRAFAWNRHEEAQ